MILSNVVSEAGSPQGAQLIVDTHEKAMTEWVTQLKAAKTLADVRAVLDAKPDTKKYRKKMIKEIGAELQKGWTLKYSSWLLQNTKLGKKDTEFILSYAEKYHLKSADAAKFCYSLVYCNASVQRKKKLIEKVLKNIKDPKAEGVASIALAVVERYVGDNPLNTARRLTLIRKAIMNSAYEKIGNVTVAEIAKDELYRINNLSKGKAAPAFMGKDSGGQPVNLANYKGRVVMLVFWSSMDLKTPETLKMLDMMKELEKKYLGMPFALVGVNRDWIANLRELEKDGLVAGKTISDSEESIYKLYRVTTPPECFVIDQKGLIQYHGALGAFASLTVDALLNPVKPVKAKAPAGR